METQKITEGVKVPNFFYDLIVFMTPSLTLTIGIISGFGNNGFNFISKNLQLLNVKGFDFLMMFIFIFIIFLFIAYEYGRLAEAHSNSVSNMVRFLRKKNILFTKQKDYSINFKNEISKLNLHEMLDDDRMDKWTIYFYIMRFQPSIGSDILKRYAWEKLSRSSAFTFGILLFISFLLSIIRIFNIKCLFDYCFIDTGIYGFGSLAYTLGALLMFILTCYEYYRRRSWNNDLLIKILPVIILPDDFIIKKNDKINKQSKTNENKVNSKKETNIK
jgi:predicted permease